MASSKYAHYYGVLWFVAFASAFSCENLNTLVSHLAHNFELQYETAPQIAAIAFLIFLPGFAGKHAFKVSQPRDIIICCGIGAGLTRFCTQLISEPSLDLFFSALGAVSFIYLLPMLVLAVSRDCFFELTLGVPLGVALKTSFDGLLETYRFVWKRDLFSLMLGFLLFVAYLISIRFSRKSVETRIARSPATLPIMATLGIPFFLNGLVFQNIGFVSALTNRSLQTAFLVISTGNLVSIILVIFVLRSQINIVRCCVLLFGIFMTIFVYWLPDGLLAIVFIWIGESALAMTTVTIVAASSKETSDFRKPPWILISTSNLGFIGFGLLMGLYYLGYLVPTPIDNSMLRLLAAVCSTFLTIAAFPTSRVAYFFSDISTAKRVIYPALLLLLFPISSQISSSSNPPGPPAQSTNTIRVMTYNIHNGFDIHGRSSIEALAAIIEQSDADVVGLQEVSRGWYINDSFDNFTWLEEHLGDYPFKVFVPTADMQWGLAIFSRYPITAYESVDLPLDTNVMHRKFVWASVDLGESEFPLIVTHLHHLPGDSHSRQRAEQVQCILKYVKRNPALLIMGDLNARPGDPAIERLFEAGWVSPQDQIASGPGYTYIYSDIVESVRIDWIFTRPHLILSDLDVVESTASDHLSVTVTVQIP